MIARKGYRLEFENRAFFHKGMREWQDKFDGRRTAEAIERRRKHYQFWDDEIDIISQARFFFIASAYEGYVDCNIKSGDPGFVQVVGPNALEYPEYDGNSMYRTLGNIVKNPNIGMLFVVFDGKSRRIRINGKAIATTDPAVLDRHFGAKVVVRVECEIYPNCPRYLPQMVDNGKSPHVPRKEHPTPPAPEWKTRDYIRDILPNDDPHRRKE